MTILKSLKACEHSETFRLKDADEILHIAPLLKSLEYERNLKILNLSGCSLFKNGQLVNRTLIQLMQLQELCLQDCNIDYDFLVKINNLPLQLRVLNLSYNPLGVNCQDKLTELITSLRHLQHLNLRYCQLKNIPSATLVISLSLEHLDISWNKIDNNDIYPFLQRQLINLNLSNTCQFPFGLIESRPLAFSTIETLEFAGCNISDSDVVNLMEICQNLSKFVLSNNPKISQFAIELLLERKPTLTLIDAAGCSTIIEKPKTNLIINDPPICTLIVSMTSEISNSWESLWQGHAIQYKMPLDIILIKPIL